MTIAVIVKLKRQKERVDLVRITTKRRTRQKMRSKGVLTMDGHTAYKGATLISRKHNPIWIDIGEEFVVLDIIQSQTGRWGVLFIDRFGGERVFWDKGDYRLVNI